MQYTYIDNAVFVLLFILTMHSESITQRFSCIGIVCNARKSLFCYQPGESWDTFYDPHFIPSYEPTFASPELESEAIGICDDDIYCLYDIATTGKVEVGIATLESSMEIEEINSLLLPGKSLTICVEQEPNYLHFT